MEVIIPTPKLTLTLRVTTPISLITTIIEHLREDHILPIANEDKAIQIVLQNYVSQYILVKEDGTPVDYADRISDITDGCFDELVDEELMIPI